MNILSLSLCTIDNLHDSLNIDLDQKNKKTIPTCRKRFYILVILQSFVEKCNKMRISITRGEKLIIFAL